jgi:hypothetical protein
MRERSKEDTTDKRRNHLYTCRILLFTVSFFYLKIKIRRNRCAVNYVCLGACVFVLQYTFVVSLLGMRGENAKQSSRMDRKGGCRL